MSDLDQRTPFPGLRPGLLIPLFSKINLLKRYHDVVKRAETLSQIDVGWNPSSVTINFVVLKKVFIFSESQSPSVGQIEGNATPWAA